MMETPFTPNAMRTRMVSWNVLPYGRYLVELIQPIKAPKTEFKASIYFSYACQVINESNGFIVDEMFILEISGKNFENALWALPVKMKQQLNDLSENNLIIDFEKTDKGYNKQDMKIHSVATRLPKPDQIEFAKMHYEKSQPRNKEPPEEI